VDFVQGMPIQRGRNTVFSQPAVGSMTVHLDNTTGKFTPLRQVLADGVTAHPYYPNLIPRRRLRYTNTPTGVRFLGYIQSFPPAMENGVRGIVTISAYDRLKLLDKVQLQTPILQEILTSSPYRVWPLTDAALSSTAVERFGNKPLIVKGGGAAPTFGAVGPQAVDGTAVSFTPGSASSGQYLSTDVSAANSAYTTRVSVSYTLLIKRVGNPTFAEGIIAVDSDYFISNVYSGLSIDTTGHVVYGDWVSAAITSSVTVTDGNFHHIALTYASNKPGSGGTYTLYVDGVSVGTTTDASSFAFPYQAVRIGQAAVGGGVASALFTGTISYPAIYLSTLSSAQVASQAAARLGYAGDPTGTRISRLLTVAGLASSDWNLDAGIATVGIYPQAGKSVLAACQELVDAEGGGAVFYIGPDGKARFADRHYRKPAAPVMTLDAVQDLIQSPFQPDYDDQNLFNSTAVTRADATGTLSTQTYTNTASQTTYGLTTDTVTSYATADADALALAQFRVAANSTPGYRLPQVAVDLMSAQNNLYAAMANVQIGSRIRINNLPAVAAPDASMDFVVEGWTETPATDSYVVQFDLSAADNPPFGIWDDTAYGRAQSAGSTLTAAITAAATTVQITTTTGPAFTTVSARYPLNIQIGQEVITLNTAPGATSPQTFTGVTRGTNGTPAAAQAINSTVTLWPAATWAF
jgi:hypothetical protein